MTTGCEAEVRRVKPKTQEELKEVVSNFVASLDKEDVRRTVRDVPPGRSSASEWVSALLSPSSRSTREEQLRSKNILYAWSCEDIDSFVMFEN